MILDNKYYIKYYQKTINNIYVPCVCSMIYLYIIDYGQNNIYRIDISIDNFTNKYKEDINNVLKKYNIKESEVYYMISDNKIDVINNIID